MSSDRIQVAAKPEINLNNTHKFNIHRYHVTTMVKQLYFILCVTKICHSEHTTIWRKLTNDYRRGTPHHLFLLESHISSILVSLLFLIVVVVVVVVMIIMSLLLLW